jgi:hypothetical protein
MSLLQLRTQLTRLPEQDLIHFRLKQLKEHYGDVAFKDMVSNWNNVEFKRVSLHLDNLFVEYGTIEVLTVYADKFINYKAC